MYGNAMYRTQEERMPEHAVSSATLAAEWPPTPITVCPATQAAARARALAATGAPVPLDGYRCRRRYCLGTFRGRREQVGQARTFLAAFLGGWARADDAVLLIGELGANAVVHTGSGQPGGLFTVRAVLAGPWLRAEVEDQGSSWDGRLETAECPHGLFLLRQLSTRCGTRRGRDGWATWFVLDSRATG
jgi:serine/threonine-protein kinase RsbW